MSGKLTAQDTYTLHKPTRKNIQRNRVLVDGIDHEWQADLVDMSSLNKENDGVNYLLILIPFQNMPGLYH